MADPDGFRSSLSDASLANAKAKGLRDDAQRAADAGDIGHQIAELVRGVFGTPKDIACKYVNPDAPACQVIPNLGNDKNRSR